MEFIVYSWIALLKCLQGFPTLHFGYLLRRSVTTSLRSPPSNSHYILWISSSKYLLRRLVFNPVEISFELLSLFFLDTLINSSDALSLYYYYYRLGVCSAFLGFLKPRSCELMANNSISDYIKGMQFKWQETLRIIFDL